MADRGRDLDRRTVLRSIALGSTLAAGVGTAAGDRGAPSSPVTDRRVALEERFGDVASVRRVVAAEAGPVVDELADLGYLDSTAHDVAVGSFLRKPDYRATDATGIASVGPGRLGDDEGPIVTVRERAGVHEIEYYLLPEHDATGYAVVSDGDGGRSVLVEPGAGARAVEADACGDCATGCTCETTCDFDEPYCECVPDDHFYYPRDREMCLKSQEGHCLCSWCEAVACDCQGGDAPVCPE